MESQLILQNLAGEVKTKPIIVMTSDAVTKMLRYVNSLEKALADVLRFTYERKVHSAS